MSEQNKRVARFVVDAFVTGDMAILEEVVDENLIDHNASRGVRSGRQGLIDDIAMYRAAFPDLEVSIEREVAEGEFVVQYGLMTGTNSGIMLGAHATGEYATIPYMDMYRIQNGCIVELWHIEDMVGMLRQLGVISE